MGNSENKSHETDKHDVYGKSETFLVNGEKYHTVPVALKEMSEGDVFIKEFNETDQFNKKHLLLSTNFKNQKAGLCGNSALLDCTFPFFPHTLKNEIERRRANNNRLRKQELMNLVYQIIDGARNFDQTEKKIGDLRPETILLNESLKKIKLINHFSVPNAATGFQKAYESKEKAYLAPEELRSLQKKSGTPDINVHKADSFSLGLTILAIGNLIAIEKELYDFSGYSFSWSQLSQQIDAFEAYYGHFLAEIVKSFVHNEPSNRLYISEIGAILQFYEKHIYEFLDFNPDFVLMRKSYESNYSGVRSSAFSSWLSRCEAACGSKRDSLLPAPEVAVTTSKVKSNVRFTYTSPTVVKSASQENLD